jgi:hypothetical protein
MFGISPPGSNPQNDKPVTSARRRRIWMAGILSLSAISTVIGLAAIVNFDQTAGAVSEVPLQWPASTPLGHPGAHGSLVVFVHPNCSCTVATLHELATLGANRKSQAERPSTTIVFYRPAHSNWQAGKLWNSALQDIPGVKNVWDDGGREASRFGARTSGYAVLYGRRGNLLFKGGVTGSRGHEGDNLGIEELRTAMDTGRPASRTSLVFGCDLTGLSL